MKLVKLLAALAIASALVVGCGSKQNTGNTTPTTNKPEGGDATGAPTKAPDQGDPCHAM